MRGLSSNVDWPINLTAGLVVTGASAASHNHNDQDGEDDALYMLRIKRLQNHERHLTVQNLKSWYLNCTLRNSLWLKTEVDV
jgi:hypothetical protein